MTKQHYAPILKFYWKPFPTVLRNCFLQVLIRVISNIPALCNLLRCWLFIQEGVWHASWSIYFRTWIFSTISLMNNNLDWKLICYILFLFNFKKNLCKKEQSLWRVRLLIYDPCGFMEMSTNVSVSVTNSTVVWDRLLADSRPINTGKRGKVKNC